MTSVPLVFSIKGGRWPGDDMSAVYIFAMRTLSCFMCFVGVTMCESIPFVSLSYLLFVLGATSAFFWANIGIECLRHWQRTMLFSTRRICH